VKLDTQWTLLPWQGRGKSSAEVKTQPNQTKPTNHPANQPTNQPTNQPYGYNFMGTATTAPQGGVPRDHHRQGFDDDDDDQRQITD
jgi:hypothetical protein